ncbi:MAG TPA: ATP-binding protein [Thermoanaerobaculia bacterium]|nr:ATP-binding protein [Thermoanaerobaculia bacterium]
MEKRPEKTRRPFGIGTLLVGLNAGLVLLAVIFVVFAALEMLERLGDEQALARVDLAGAGARQAVERSADDVLTSAQLLAERPTVGRLLQERDAASLSAFLDRFHQTSQLTGCAVFSGRELFAQSGPLLDWERLREAAQHAGDTEPLLLRNSQGGLLLVAVTGMVSVSDATAVTALALDSRFEQELARQVGLPVRLLPAERALAESGDSRRPLRDRALDSGQAVSARLDAAGIFLSILPLANPGGEVAALVETALDTGAVESSLSRLESRLLWFSLLAAAVAILSGYLISRRLARPVQDLTVAAALIGYGDLQTPMPRVPGRELGSLAGTMEEMRRRLQRLTSELRRRQAEGEAILTGITEGVFSVDRDRRIRYLNPQAASLLGVRPAEALGKFCGDVLYPGQEGKRPCEEDCPIVHARFRGATSAAEHVQRPDGTRRAVVITSAAPTEDRQFQVIRDETDVEAARRLRDAVLAHISHEFKTPLSAQLASIELLRDRLGEGGAADPVTVELVRALERGSLRLTQLIDNLLESVRIESGQGSLRSHPVALDEVVEEAVEMVAPLLSQRGQRLEVDLPYPLPSLLGDGPRLTQVFVNLLGNANKFAPAGSVIRIGGAVEEDEVVLWVEDEGPGMPSGATGSAAAEEGGRTLFGRFVRSSVRGEEPEQSGMGLGLWIVQSIVERHGGTVEARRAGPGTRMVVRLPDRDPARLLAPSQDPSRNEKRRGAQA